MELEALSFYGIMQCIRSICVNLANELHDFKAFRYIISVFDDVKIFQSKGVIKGITCKGPLGSKSNYIFQRPLKLHNQ